MISLRDEHGDVLQARQVSTQSETINVFFQQLSHEHLHAEAPFVAVLEVLWLQQLADSHAAR
jgi:hypothetical protein